MCPYIPQDARETVLRNGAVTGGELAFELLNAVRAYIARKEAGDCLNYNAFADVVAALEVTKFTFQDSDLRVYESAKRHQNGDV